MDTLLILRDTVTTNVVTVINSCQPCIHEAETNCPDVQIVFFICSAIVLSILIIAVTMGIIVCRYNRKTKECNELKETFIKSVDLSQKVNDLDEIKKLKEKVDKLSKSNDGKEGYEIACEVLDKISSLARPKDGITDKEVVDKLYSLYTSIKKDIHETTRKKPSEG